MKVSIVGSCVTRDALAARDDVDFDLVRYTARTSLVSLEAAAPSSADKFPLSNISSDFRRRMVEWDTRKQAREAIMADQSDLIVYDLIDERFSVGLFGDGGRVTLSSEFLEMGLPLPADLIQIGPWEERRFALWRAAWASFLERLEAAGKRDRLLVHGALWSTTIRDRPGDSPAKDPEEIETANRTIQRMLDEVAHTLGEEAIFRPDPEKLIVDPAHRWGITPFHYVSEYYGDLRARMLSHV